MHVQKLRASCSPELCKFVELCDLFVYIYIHSYVGVHRTCRPHATRSMNSEQVSDHIILTLPSLPLHAFTSERKPPRTL